MGGTPAYLLPSSSEGSRAVLREACPCSDDGQPPAARPRDPEAEWGDRQEGR